METKDKGILTITVGDKSADGKIDVTTGIEARLPFLGIHRTALGPYNVPADQALATLDGLAKSVPVPAVRTTMPLLAGFLRALVDSKTSGALTIVVGDRSNDGKIDVTVTVDAKFPSLGAYRTAFGPFNIPLNEALAAVDAISKAVPVPAVGAVVPLVTGFLRAAFVA